MNPEQQERRIWKCPQCRKQFKIPADSTPKLCPTCAAFEEIVEESAVTQKPPASTNRWGFLRRRKNRATPEPVRQTDYEPPEETQDSAAAIPQCRKCGGPLIGKPMKRDIVSRRVREFVHITIGLSAFALPPYGIVAGVAYILIMHYIEKKRPMKRYWMCEHCGRRTG